MSELDNKTAAIVGKFVVASHEDMVGEIKQAFIDDGWHEHGTALPDSVAQKLNIMTGQEWYDKFEKTLKGWESGAYSGDVMAVKGAAKKAAGIE